MNPYLALTKPRLTLLALGTVFSSYYLASARPLAWPALFHALVGAALIGGGASSLNQYLERNIDARMKRTEKRPIPSGKIGEKKALTFGVLLSIAGIAYLRFLANPLTGALGFMTVVSYVFFYTPLKQRTILNTYMGAISGAMPCLLGWAAASGGLSVEAWALFSILFLWQLPHFLAIGWIYREDYKKGGLQMLSTLDPDGKRTSCQLIFYSIALLGATLVPAMIGITGLLYLSAVIMSGLLFTSFAWYIATHRLIHVKAFVPASILYLATINIFMLLDKL